MSWLMLFLFQVGLIEFAGVFGNGALAVLVLSPLLDRLAKRGVEGNREDDAGGFLHR